jgi:hypothetical protein
MKLEDLIIAPIVAFIIYGIALLIRPSVTYEENRKYFLPALTLKLLGAILLGVLYQFYYGGGDTFGYYNGATHIFDAFYTEPGIGLKLIFNETNYQGGVYPFASKIWMYPSPTEYMIVRIAGAFAILTGGTYTGIALLFAVVSFSGLWAMYMAFSKLFPSQLLGLAIAILFIPSTIFWGSGILKDSITFGLLGWSTAALIHLLYWQRRSWLWLSVLVLSLVLAFSIKEYIVLSFLPAAMIWGFFVIIKKVHNKVLRVLIAPFMLTIMIFLSAYTVYKVGENSPRYSLANIAETAKITAYDIGRWTGRDAGSSYDLGDLDGSLTSMIRLAPSAINVSLFRPYLWEVRSPLMLLASLEGLVLMVITIIILFRMMWFKVNVLKSPAAWFSLVFSITFAFAVGISTYNFGTLFRYKVPLMPFFAILLVLAWRKSQQGRRNSRENRSVIKRQL